MVIVQAAIVLLTTIVGIAVGLFAGCGIISVLPNAPGMILAGSVVVAIGGLSCLGGYAVAFSLLDWEAK